MAVGAESLDVEAALGKDAVGHKEAASCIKMDIPQLLSKAELMMICHQG
jgi:hypothetical protein